MGLCHTVFCPKEGGKDDAGNWRLISQTNPFAKLLEKLVHGCMLEYLVNNNLLSVQQIVCFCLVN